MCYPSCCCVGKYLSDGYGEHKIHKLLEFMIYLALSEKSDSSGSS